VENFGCTELLRISGARGTSQQLTEYRNVFFRLQRY
jgi:hypothetical protein